MCGRRPRTDAASEEATVSIGEIERSEVVDIAWLTRIKQALKTLGGRLIDMSSKRGCPLPDCGDTDGSAGARSSARCRRSRWANIAAKEAGRDRRPRRKMTAPAQGGEVTDGGLVFALLPLEGAVSSGPVRRC